MVEQSTTAAGRTAITPLWRAGMITMVAATAANLGVYIIADALLSTPLVVPEDAGTLNAVSVIVASMIGIGSAITVFAVLKRVTTRPVNIFRIVAVIAGLVSLAGPLGTPGIALPVRAVLALMHVVAAAIAIGVLTASSRSP